MKAVPAVAILVAVGFLVTGCGAANKTSAPGRSAPRRSGRHLVGASGLVVVEHGTARFCGGMPVALGSAVPPCPGGLLVRGVDLSRLSKRVDRDGATWGFAYLAGTFRDGTLTVVRQGPPRRSPPLAPAWRKPPCPPPAGGWPAGGPVNPVVPHLRDVMAVTIFRPRHGPTVVVVASSHPVLTRRSAPKSGLNLCVIRSRYSERQLARTKTRLTQILTRGIASARNDYLTAVGSISSPSGQPLVSVQALVDTPELETLVHSAPAGIIALDLWLRPVRTR